MSNPSLSHESARNLVLRAQGLSHLPAKAARKEDIATSIRELSLLQIDTINIVARAPYFILFSRLGTYDPAWLDESLAKKSIFEYWAHAASFLPIEDYPYHRRMMLEKLRHPYYYTWYEKNKPECDKLLAHVRTNGPVRSADFERQDGKRGTWWDWKFEKDALEFWFCAGELMISRRDKFQRVYDLRGRVLPDWKDSDAPSLDETYRHFVRESVRALGIARRDWVADYFRLAKKPVNEALTKLLEDGILTEVTVETWSEPAIMLSEDLPLLKKRPKDLTPILTTILSPFDSLVFDRKRTKQLFDFDFTIECYLPPAKRKYGYFLVPVLHRGQLVGRADVKAHRKEGIFEVKGMFWEPGIKADEQMLAEVKDAIQRCADWHGTPEVVIKKTNLPNSKGFSSGFA
jgi:uncharacterized protein YcaQ